LIRTFVSFAVGLLILAMPLVAVASGDAYDRSGPYVSLFGLYQNNFFEDKIDDLLQDAASPVAASLSIEDSGGLGVVVGYRLASFFAVEVQYDWVDEYSIEGSVAGSATADIFSLSGHTLTGNTKFILPFWRIQPYFLVGVGFASSEVDRGPLAPAIELLDPEIDIDGGNQFSLAGRAGLGLDFYLTKNLVVNAQGQVVLTTLKEPGLGEVDDFNYVGFTAGMQYRF